MDSREGRGPLIQSELEELKNEKVQMLRIMQTRKAGSAITWRELSEQLGLTQHEVWGLITELWRDKEPVCTDGIGYWYSEDIREMTETYHFLGNHMLMFQEGTIAYWTRPPSPTGSVDDLD